MTIGRTLTFGSLILSPFMASVLADVRQGDSKPDLKMNVIVGSSVFHATLEDNQTARAFQALLPLTIEMHDVNANEKAYDLPSRLPSRDSNPRTIRKGDIMLWSSRTVVVFYKSFPTPYHYTRLGRIEDPEGLAAALGDEDVTVTLDLDHSRSSQD